MKISKWFEPYKNGKPALEYKKTQRPAVYFIKENNKIVYVGMSATNLYKTLYRHFQTWNDKRAQYRSANYTRKTYDKTAKVRVIFCTALQADRLETYLIQKLKPRDNEHKYKDVPPPPPINIEKIEYIKDENIFIPDDAF
jgi:excinuclease UvrABC nuclease subunit